MVLNFAEQYEKTGKKLVPGRFEYYILYHMQKKLDVSQKMCLVKEYTPDKVIDIMYYFNSLADICASLLSCDTKQALEMIKEIYNADKNKKQLLLTNYFSSSLSENKKHPLDPSSSTSLNKRQKKITEYFT